MALAAQKTLENVIGGLSILLDRAVRVGDVLQLDKAIGTVEFVGLRSTRIRTVDRSVLSVPNRQIAAASIVTVTGELSATAAGAPSIAIAAPRTAPRRIRLFTAPPTTTTY